MLLKFWIIRVFEYFISSIEIFLLTLIENLITYIKNENFKGFTMKNTKLYEYRCMCLCMFMKVCIS